MVNETTLLPFRQAVARGNDSRYFQAQDPKNQLRADPTRRIPVRYL